MRSKKLILFETDRKIVHSVLHWMLAETSIVTIEYRVPVRFLGIIFRVKRYQDANASHWLGNNRLNPVQVLKRGLNIIEANRNKNRKFRQNEIKYNKQRERYARGLDNIQKAYNETDRQREIDRGEITDSNK